jgi:hypothetical protein
MKNIGNIILNIISLIIAITGGLMSIDATVHALGIFSPAVSLWWPVVLAGSTCINRIALIAKNLYGDWKDDGSINNSYPKATGPLVLAGLMLLVSGCSTTGPDSAKNIRNAGINAAGSAALKDAARILGSVATSVLLQQAQQDIGGSSTKADLASSASAAVWSQVNSQNIGSSISDIVAANSAGKLRQTGIEAQKAADAALAHGKSDAAVTNAIATVISTAAGAPPKL